MLLPRKPEKPNTPEPPCLSEAQWPHELRGYWTSPTTIRSVEFVYYFRPSSGTEDKFLEPLDPQIDFVPTARRLKIPSESKGSKGGMKAGGARPTRGGGLGGSRIVYP